MKQRLFTLCFALIAVTLGAMAEELYVAGKNVTLSGSGEVTLSGGDIMGGTVKYNRDTKTLTLSGATIARTGNNNRGIRSSVSGLTIVFSGKNIISTTSAAALRFEANTTIKGSGTVTVKSDETALYVYKNTTVTISGVDRNRLTLTLNGKYGIQGEDGISDENVSLQRYVTLTASGSDNAIKLLNDLTVSGDANVTLKGNDTNLTVNNLASLALTEGLTIDLPLCGQFDSSMKTIVQCCYTIPKGYQGDVTIKPAVVAFNATSFPDDHFRSYVKKYGNANEDDYLSDSEIQALDFIWANQWLISDMTGVAYYTALEELHCSGNSLTSLDLSKNTALKELKCNGNNLTYLNVSSNTALEELYCYDNSLKSLDVSNNTALTELDCSGNSLKSLDVSNNKALTTLRCFGNQIRGAAMTNLVNSLPTRPDNDGNFIVYDYQNEGNIITPDQVKVAKDKGWAVKKLNNYGNVVNYAGEEAIAIDATNFPDDNFRKIVAAKDINTDGDNYLSVEEMDAVWMLDVENKGIADLTGVGNFWNLIALMCSGNTLTNLDVSKNTELVGLDCSNNRLTALNFSQNTVLSEVLCYGNNIKGEAMTSLVNSLPQMDDGSLCVIEEGASNDNVITKGQVEIAKKKGWNVLKINGSNIIDYEGASIESIPINEKNFPDPNFRNYLLEQDYGKDAVLTETEILAITELDLYSKSISNLTGIEHFTALTKLNCSWNSLKSMDISKNTALKELDCHSSSLESLDVSMNTALTYLDCSYNTWTIPKSIDVSKNTALTYLDCSAFYLESLDVSKNTALTFLRCTNNSLHSLDVSKNTALTYVECWNNSLLSLDVSNKTALKVLNCSGNSLESLVVSNCLALTELDCKDNNLKVLDVSTNTALTNLYCGYNRIGSLNVSKNTALTELDCQDNNLNTLDVSKNTALTWLYCPNNLIIEAAMSSLVNSLRSLPSETKGHFVVCSDRNTPDNIITAAQVKIATDKGWTVNKLGCHNILMDYAGLGDVNGDNKIDKKDLDLIVKIIMGQRPDDVAEFAGDLNNDGKTDAADIVVMVNILKALGVK